MSAQPNAEPDDAVIRGLIHRWAASVRGADLAGVLADHRDDIVMFDVPPPEQGVRGIEPYASAWPPFFDLIRSGATFEIVELDVVADTDVAFAWALVRCGSPADLRSRPDRRLRLTFGLRRDDGRWTIAHEHHSFTHG